MAGVYVLDLKAFPAVRISREADGTIVIAFDAAEWAAQRESDNFASWVRPIASLCADHDEIARALDLASLPLRTIGDEIAKLARTMVDAGELHKCHGRWRFTAGPCPESLARINIAEGS